MSAQRQDDFSYPNSPEPSLTTTNYSHSLRIGGNEYSTESTEPSITTKLSFPNTPLSSRPPPGTTPLPYVSPSIIPRPTLQQTDNDEQSYNPQAIVIPIVYEVSSSSPHHHHQHVPGWGGSMTEVSSEFPSPPKEEVMPPSGMNTSNHPLIPLSHPIHQPYPSSLPLLYSTFPAASSSSSSFAFTRIPHKVSSIPPPQEYTGNTNTTSSSNNSTTIRHLELLANSHIQLTSSLSSSTTTSNTSHHNSRPVTQLNHKHTTKDVKNILLSYMLTNNNLSSAGDNTNHHHHNSLPNTQQKHTSLSSLTSNSTSTTHSRRTVPEQPQTSLGDEEEEMITLDCTENESPQTSSSSSSSSQTTPPITNASISRASSTLSSPVHNPSTNHKDKSPVERIATANELPPSTTDHIPTSTMLGKKRSLEFTKDDKSTNNDHNNAGGNGATFVPPFYPQPFTALPSFTPPIITIPEPVENFSYVRYARSIPLDQQLHNQEKIRKVQQYLDALRKTKQFRFGTTSFSHNPIIDTDTEDDD